MLISKAPTPHISAKFGDFAETVIMPGDPLRARMVAQKFLTKPVLVNSVRGMEGYTGFYKDKKVSVMASGMGNASMGIYSYELFKFYGVKNIIRIGSAGACKEDLKLKDIVLAQKMFTSSNYDSFLEKKGSASVSASPVLLKTIKETANMLNIKLTSGSIFSTDTLYGGHSQNETCKKKGCVAIEMETAALYINAKKLGGNAATVCTISDSLFFEEKSSAEERQNSFTEMVLLVLESIFNI